MKSIVKSVINLIEDKLLKVRYIYIWLIICHEGWLLCYRVFLFKVVCCNTRLLGLSLILLGCVIHGINAWASVVFFSLVLLKIDHKLIHIIHREIIDFHVLIFAFFLSCKHSLIVKHVEQPHRGQKIYNPCDRLQ